MRKLTPIILLIFIVSCKEHFYKAGASGMEGTIKTGESFAVTEVDTFKRNDIVVFDYFGPDYTSMQDEDGKWATHWEKRVYRLVAYSGDSVEIKEGDVFVNGELIPAPPKAKMYYEVLATVPVEEFIEMDPYTATITKSGDTMGYTVMLTTEQAFSYRQKKPAIISVKKTPAGFDRPDTAYARSAISGNWTSYNYGPVRIPSPGETIAIDSINYKLYHNIPGISPGKYLLTEKLYFVLGDNRYGAEDSRYIGFIAHSKMYGIVK